MAPETSTESSDCLHSQVFMTNAYLHLREGVRKKKTVFHGLLPYPPRPPSPRCGLFGDKQIIPFFLLEIIPHRGELFFTLGPILKCQFFVL